MALASPVRTIKHGVLTITDSAAASITVNGLAGGLSCQLKNQPHQVIRDRGTLDQWMQTDSEPIEFSFDVQCDGIIGNTTAGFANLRVAEAFGVANNNTVTLATTSDSPTGEPNSVNLILTITNPAGSAPATEVLTFSECVVDVIQFEEGYPGMLKFSGKALSVTPTAT